jgi:hypothetical protein
VINFNAAILSVNNIGLSTQQILGSASSGTNNFQAIIESLMGSGTDSGKADAAAAIQSDPAIQAAVYQSITALFMLGRIEAAAKSTNTEIANNPVIQNVMADNNLTPAQQQTVISAIKIISTEMASNNMQSAQPQLDLLNTNAAPVAGAPVITPPASAAGQPLPLTFVPLDPGAPVLTPASVINAASNQAQAGTTAASVSVPQAPAVLTPVGQAQVIALSTQPAAVNVITDPRQATTIPVDNKPASIVPGSGNTSQASLPVTPVAVNPAAGPQPLPPTITMPGRTISVAAPSNSAVSNSGAAAAADLAAQLQQLISDYVAFVYQLTENKKDVPEGAKLINNKITELTNKLNQLSALPAGNAQAIKDLTNQAADILSVIASALSNMTSSFVNSTITQAKNNVDDALAGAVLNNGSNQGTGNGQGSGRQIQVASSMDTAAKDIIIKIYGMLKQMNGQLTISNKIELVYAPYTTQSSKMMQDGTLLINTAVKPGVIVSGNDSKTIPAGSVETPAAPVAGGNSNAAVVSNDSVISNNNTEQAAVSQDLTAVTASTVNKATISANEPVAPATTQDVAGNSVKQPVAPAFGPAAADVVLNQAKVTPVYGNQGKSSLLTDQSSKKTYGDAAWLSGQIKTYMVTSKEDAQIVVPAKTFEKVADFAGRVKEDIVIRQVVENIHDAVQLTTSRTEIKINLRPDNLGPVSIRLDSRDKVITGHIEVASQDVKDILKANLPTLRESLTNMGLNVDKLDVSMMNQHIGGNLNDSGHNQYREWEGGTINIEADELMDNAGAYSGADNYLNYLA